MSNETLKNIGLGLIGTLVAVIYSLIVDHTKLSILETEVAHRAEIIEQYVIQLKEQEAQILRLNLYVDQHQEWILRVQNKAEQALSETQKHNH